MKIGISAPRSIAILRKEILDEMNEKTVVAAQNPEIPLQMIESQSEKCDGKDEDISHVENITKNQKELDRQALSKLLDSILSIPNTHNDEAPIIAHQNREELVSGSSKKNSNNIPTTKVISRRQKAFTSKAPKKKARQAKRSVSFGAESQETHDTESVGKLFLKMF